MYKNGFSVACVAIVFATKLIMLSPGIGIAAGGNSGSAPAPPFLDKLPPTWSQKLPAAQRFEVVLDGGGVLDKETGLVWQQLIRTRLRTWNAARAQCDVVQIGGRRGWHLPTVEQLASLIDMSSNTYFKLPVGHPFTFSNPEDPESYFWSASPYPGESCCAYSVNFATGLVEGYGYDGELHTMCVRGGQSYVGE
jgi:hypothetical protein